VLHLTQKLPTTTGSIKRIGFNAIRLAHNPPAPELLDLADRMGFLLLMKYLIVGSEKNATRFSFDL
jgi:beta-galactosidase